MSTTDIAATLSRIGRREIRLGLVAYPVFALVLAIAATVVALVSPPEAPARRSGDAEAPVQPVPPGRERTSPVSPVVDQGLLAILLQAQKPDPIAPGSIDPVLDDRLTSTFRDALKSRPTLDFRARTAHGTPEQDKALAALLGALNNDPLADLERLRSNDPITLAEMLERLERLDKALRDLAASPEPGVAVPGDLKVGDRIADAPVRWLDRALVPPGATLGVIKTASADLILLDGDRQIRAILKTRPSRP